MNFSSRNNSILAYRRYGRNSLAVRPARNMLRVAIARAIREARPSSIAFAAPLPITSRTPLPARRRLAVIDRTLSGRPNHHAGIAPAICIAVRPTPRIWPPPRGSQVRRGQGHRCGPLGFERLGSDQPAVIRPGDLWLLGPSFREGAQGCIQSRNSRRIAISAERPAIPGHWREWSCLDQLAPLNPDLFVTSARLLALF